MAQLRHTYLNLKKPVHAYNSILLRHADLQLQSPCAHSTAVATISVFSGYLFSYDPFSCFYPISYIYIYILYICIYIYIIPCILTISILICISGYITAKWAADLAYLFLLPTERILLSQLFPSLPFSLLCLPSPAFPSPSLTSPSLSLVFSSLLFCLPN